MAHLNASLLLNLYKNLGFCKIKNDLNLRVSGFFFNINNLWAYHKKVELNSGAELLLNSSYSSANLNISLELLFTFDTVRIYKRVSYWKYSNWK